MKYENSKQAFELVRQISDLEDDLVQLEDKEVTVVITLPRTQRIIMTVGAYLSSEHPHAKHAITCVDWIKDDIRTRIDLLKTKLDTL